jgi:MFS family permease
MFSVFAARFSLRSIVIAIGLGLGISAMLLQVVNSYAGVVLTFVLFAVAGGTAFIVILSLAPQWFDTYRGIATSITVIGIGLGPLLLPFVWLRLLGQMNFRTAFAVVAGIAAVTVLVSSLFYHRPPSESETISTVDRSWLRNRIDDTRFLGTALGFTLIWTWYLTFSSHLVEILAANNFDRRIAAAGLGIIGGVSIFSRIGGGVIGDRFGQRKTYVVSVALPALFILAIPLSHSNLAIYIILAGLGIGLGPLASLWSPIVLKRFGHENATATIGLLTLTSGGSAFLGPLGLSVLYHVTGGYVIPLVALSVATFLGAGLFAWGTAPQEQTPSA